MSKTKLSKTSRKLFDAMRKRGLDDDEHIKYFLEECRQLDLINGWQSILEKAMSDHKSLNSYNLMASYLLGISKYDPLKPRLFKPVAEGEGIKEEGRTLVFEDDTEVTVHFNSVVRDWVTEEIQQLDPHQADMKVVDLKPGDCIPKKIVAIVPEDGWFVEVQQEEDLEIAQDVVLVPQKGVHMWYERNEPPDIDVDFAPSTLPLVIPWAKQHYGETCVAPVCTYQRFSTKSSIRDLLRVWGFKPYRVDEIADGLPDEIEDLNLSKPEDQERFDQIIHEDEVLGKWLREGIPDADLSAEEVEKLFWTMKKMQGRVRTFGKHASAMIIADRSLYGRVPMIMRDGEIMCSWVEGQNRSELSVFGYVKFDRLGSQTLENAAKCLELLYQRGKLDPKKGLFRHLVLQYDWSDESFMEDPKVLKLASEGRTIGVFQFESGGLRAMLKNMGVDSFEDMIAANAMYRPAILKAKVVNDDGSVTEGGHTAYAERKKGERAFHLPPALEPVLGYTYGLPIYQEQIMQVLNIVGGIPLTECESARKAISKKKVEVLKKFKEQFIKNAGPTIGWDEDKAFRYFDDTIVSWSGYGFNRSHSAAYAKLAAVTLYLKAHFPIEFYIVFMSSLKRAKKDYARIKVFCGDAAQEGIDIIGADVNTSDLKYSIANDPENPKREVIRFGLASVKGVGKKAEDIIKNQPYENFTDFLEYGTDFRTAVTALIRAGACDGFGRTRGQMLDYYESYRKAKGKGVGIMRFRQFLKELGLDKMAAKEYEEEFREALKNTAWEDEPDQTDPDYDYVEDILEYEDELIELPESDLIEVQEKTEVQKKADEERKAATETNRNQMPIEEFERYVRKRFRDQFDWFSEVEPAFEKVQAEIPKAKYRKVPELTYAQRYDNCCEAYGVALPFFHPMRTLKGEVHWIRDYGKQVEWHRIDGQGTIIMRRDTIDAFVVKCDARRSKTNKKYYRLLVDDGYDFIRLTVFYNQWWLSNVQGEIYKDENGIPVKDGYTPGGLPKWKREVLLRPADVIAEGRICRFKIRTPDKWGAVLQDFDSGPIVYKQQQRHPVIPLLSGIDWSDKKFVMPDGVRQDQL